MFLFSARMNVAMQSIEPSLISAQTHRISAIIKSIPVWNNVLLLTQQAVKMIFFQLPGHLILERVNFVLDFASL